MNATFDDLVALMARLRSPEGCPWDREQTYATLAPMLLEEAYEAFEAVEAAREGRPDELCDELGDLLFQIVFYAQVAGERGEFAVGDVIEAIHTKMVRRHPHVFSDGSAKDAEEVLRNWEAIKAEEKRVAAERKGGGGESGGAAKSESLLDGVSTKAPALMEAHQLSTKAARVGFDWQHVDDIFSKLHEEIDELRAAINEHSEAGDEAGETRVREEVGDLLFAVVNIARHLKADPEAALKLTNRKFRRRFHHIEDGLTARGRSFEVSSLDEMEALWQEAKMNEGKPAPTPPACAACGAKVGRAKFCPECGAPVERSARHTCQSCGHQYADRPKFCPECGAETPASS
ncbi:MAG: nucleoside triphosphate pyrophosphohydrolase [Pyrinomonadaceae bacterium]